MASKINLFVFVVLFLFLDLSFASATQIGGNEENPFAILYEEGPLEVKTGQTYNVAFNFQIPSEYYLYEDKLDITLIPQAGFSTQTLVKPIPIAKHDPYLNKIVAVYYNEILVTLPVVIPSETTLETVVLTGGIRIQGCSDKLCYRPMTFPIEVAFSLPQNHKKSPLPISDQNEDKNESLLSWIQLVGASNFDLIYKRGLWVMILVVFWGGVLTDFTPCVLPIVPITLAVIGVRKDRNVFSNLFAVSVLVLGMAVMYSILGVIVAALGKSLGFLFQNVLFLILVDIFLVLMALSLFGLFEIRIPSSIQTRLATMATTGYRGIFFSGFIMGILAAPCVGPVIGPLLVFVAQTQNLVLGFFLFFVYAMGMGSLFFVLGGFYGYIQIRLVSGAFSLWLKKGLGVLLLLVAVYYGYSIYGHIHSSGVHKERWSHTLDEGLMRASKEHKPVVIDFFATWCLPCLELDKTVFQRKEIGDRLDGDFIGIKIDCSKETKECNEAIKKFGVIGWPTVVFLDAHQNEVKKERLVGKVVSADEMQEILTRVKKSP